MKNLMTRSLVLGVVLGLLFSPLLSLQAQKAPDSGQKKININTASVTELQALPRIGPKVAQRIIDYRKENGNFKRAEEIMKVRGIGEKVFQIIKDLITVEDEPKKK